jgi:hypothetical protein
VHSIYETVADRAQIEQQIYDFCVLPDCCQQCPGALRRPLLPYEMLGSARPCPDRPTSGLPPPHMPAQWTDMVQGAPSRRYR